MYILHTTDSKLFACSQWTLGWPVNWAATIKHTQRSWRWWGMTLSCSSESPAADSCMQRMTRTELSCGTMCAVSGRWAGLSTGRPPPQHI